MKRYCFGLFLTFFMALNSWVQAADAPFDMAKTQKELEIMRGIFKTTLSYGSDDSQRNSFFNFADIRFLYLTDQGVNFYVQNPGFSPPVIALDDIGIQFDEAALQTTLETMEENLKIVQENLKQKGIDAGEYDSARKSIEEANAEVKRGKEAWEAQRAKMQEQQKEMQRKIQAQNERIAKQKEDQRQKLTGIKESLIEAVAKYGDSLTTVKNDEYINLVFDASGEYDIVSIQKSWIKDYKAGVLTLDQFKAKTIQYSMKGR